MVEEKLRGSEDGTVLTSNTPSDPIVCGGATTHSEAIDLADLAYDILAIEKREGRPEEHQIPGFDMSDPNNPWELADYVYTVIDFAEKSDRNILLVGRFEGPYYGDAITYGPHAGERKKAYWDNEKQVIVRDPVGKAGGTVFKPNAGRAYLNQSFPNQLRAEYEGGSTP